MDSVSVNGVLHLWGNAQPYGFRANRWDKVQTARLKHTGRWLDGRNIDECYIDL